jgi:dihydroorotate dehydrogenase
LAHELVWAYCRNYKKRFEKPVEVKITAVFKDKKLRDVDNICEKLYIDGIKKINIIKDDDTRFVKRTVKEIVKGKTNKVIINIKEVK